MNRRLVLGVSIGALALAGVGAWLWRATEPTIDLDPADAKRLEILQADGGSAIVPISSIEVRESTRGPCLGSDVEARLVRTFRASTTTEAVFADVDAKFTSLGWQKVSVKRPPESDLPGEAEYEKTLSGWRAKATVYSYIEDTPHIAKFGRPPDGNLVIVILVPPAARC